MTNLRGLVIDKIKTLGVKDAAKFYGVSLGTVSNWLTGKTSPSISAVEMTMGDASPADIGFAPPQKIDGDYEKNEPVIKWEGRKVMILLPVYRTFNADTHFTLFANYAKYGPSKVGMEVIKRTMIHDARNMLIDKWMKTDVPTAIMADDDMVFPCGSAALMNGRYGAGISDELASKIMIDQLMKSGIERGIVGGLYYGRHSSGQAQCQKGMMSREESNKFRRREYTGYVPQEWVATGCLKIERWVIEKMRAEIDADKWPECKPVAEGSWYGYFNPLAARVGEDVSFGRRAKEIGIQSYLDADLVCLHAGETLFGPANTK